MTRYPDFDDLIGGDVPAEERERLRRAHELLVEAGPPPELSPEMESVPWPDENPDAWNVCELGGLDMPGLANVKVRLSEELDIKKPKGGHGATITHQGYNPARVTITLRQTLTGLLPRFGSYMVRRAAAATIEEALDGLERISG